MRLPILAKLVLAFGDAKPLAQVTRRSRIAMAQPRGQITKEQDSMVRPGRIAMIDPMTNRRFALAVETAFDSENKPGGFRS